VSLAGQGIGFEDGRAGYVCDARILPLLAADGIALGQQLRSVSPIGVSSERDYALSESDTSPGGVGGTTGGSLLRSIGL